MNDELRRHYHTLDLEPNTSLADIKVAYREQVQFYHPDKHAHNAKAQAFAEKKLKKLNEAREVLVQHARENAERQAREEATQRAREQAKKRARENAERQAREEATKRARQEAKRKARGEKASSRGEKAATKYPDEPVTGWAAIWGTVFAAFSSSSESSFTGGFDEVRRPSNPPPAGEHWFRDPFSVFSLILFIPILPLSIVAAIEFFDWW